MGAEFKNELYFVLRPVFHAPFFFPGLYFYVYIESPNPKNPAGPTPQAPNPIILGTVPTVGGAYFSSASAYAIAQRLRYGAIYGVMCSALSGLTLMLHVSGNDTLLLFILYQTTKA